MKSLILALSLMFGAGAIAAEPAKKAETKQETNCVKKDKNGKCPPAPKGEKPTPQKVEKKAEAKK